MLKKELLDVLRGEKELFCVFWGYYVIGSLLIVLLVLLLSSVGEYLGFGKVLFWLWVPLVGVYSLWVTIGLWRCAFNTKRKIWGYLTRGMVILIVIGYLQEVVKGIDYWL